MSEVTLRQVSAEGNHRTFQVYLNDDLRGQPIPIPSPSSFPVRGSARTLAEGLAWFFEDFGDASHGPLEGEAENVFYSLATWRETVNGRLMRVLPAPLSGPTMHSLTVESDSAETLTWPWECIGSSATLSVYRIPASAARPPMRSRADMARKCLKVLLVTARAETGDIGCNRIFDVLSRVAATAGGRLHVKLLYPPTLENLEEHLRAFPYDILHIDAHGHAATPDARASVELEDKRGGLLEIADLALARVLARSGVPLVVLNACESALVLPGKDSVDTTLAATLVAQGVPAVVAMSQRVRPDTAQVFSIAFYEALCGGLSIAAAMASARSQLFSVVAAAGALASDRQRLDWLVPAFYGAESIVLDVSTIECGKPVPNGTDDGTGKPTIEFSDSLRRILQLFESEADVVLLHGMTGSGKTTLARQVCESMRSLAGRENAIRWLRVSDLGDKAKAEELGSELRGTFTLIVLEDVPTKGFADLQIARSFLHACSGGHARVLAVSRAPIQDELGGFVAPCRLPGLREKEAYLLADFWASLRAGHERTDDTVQRSRGHAGEILCGITHFGSKEWLPGEPAIGEGCDTCLALSRAVRDFAAGLLPEALTAAYGASLFSDYCSVADLALLIGLQVGLSEDPKADLRDVDLSDHTGALRASAVRVLEELTLGGLASPHGSSYAIHRGLRRLLYNTPTLHRDAIALTERAYCRLFAIRSMVTARRMDRQRQLLHANRQDILFATRLAHSASWHAELGPLGRLAAHDSLMHGDATRAVETLAAVIDSNAPLDERAWAHSDLADLALRESCLLPAAFHSGAAFEVARGLGSTVEGHFVMVDLLEQKGRILESSGEYEAAESAWLSALQFGPPDHDRIADIMTSLGRAKLQRGDYAGAEERLVAAKALAAKADRADAEANALMHFGMLRLERRGDGDMRKAEGELSSCAHIAERHDLPLLGKALGLLGQLEQQCGRTAQACRYYERAFSVATRRAAPDGADFALQLGRLSRASGHLSAASKWLLTSLVEAARRRHETTGHAAEHELADLFNSGTEETRAIIVEQVSEMGLRDAIFGRLKRGDNDD